MDELEMLAWLFVVLQLVLPVALMCARKWRAVIPVAMLAGLSMLVFYYAVVRTAYIVEAEIHKALIGISVNK